MENRYLRLKDQSHIYEINLQIDKDTKLNHRINIRNLQTIRPLTPSISFTSIENNETFKTLEGIRSIHSLITR